MMTTTTMTSSMPDDVLSTKTIPTSNVGVHRYHSRRLSQSNHTCSTPSSDRVVLLGKPIQGNHNNAANASNDQAVDTTNGVEGTTTSGCSNDDPSFVPAFIEIRRSPQRERETTPAVVLAMSPPKSEGIVLPSPPSAQSPTRSPPVKKTRNHNNNSGSRHHRHTSSTSTSPPSSSKSKKTSKIRHNKSNNKNNNTTQPHENSDEGILPTISLVDVARATLNVHHDMTFPTSDGMPNKTDLAHVAAAVVDMGGEQQERQDPLLLLLQEQDGTQQRQRRPHQGRHHKTVAATTKSKSFRLSSYSHEKKKKKGGKAGADQYNRLDSSSSSDMILSQFFTSESQLSVDKNWFQPPATTTTAAELPSFSRAATTMATTTIATTTTSLSAHPVSPTSFSRATTSPLLLTPSPSPSRYASGPNATSPIAGTSPTSSSSSSRRTRSSLPDDTNSFCLQLSLTDGKAIMMKL